MILGIDPGRNLGWAVVHESTGALLRCGLGEPDRQDYSLVVIEKPQVYPFTPAKEANDLISVAVCVGRMAERFGTSPIQLVLPHTWKGSIPKQIHNGRVLAKLTASEMDVFHRVRATKKDDVIDAIGLAKYGLRLLGQRPR